MRLYDVGRVEDLLLEIVKARAGKCPEVRVWEVLERVTEEILLLWGGTGTGCHFDRGKGSPLGMRHQAHQTRFVRRHGRLVPSLWLKRAERAGMPLSGFTWSGSAPPQKATP